MAAISEEAFVREYLGIEPADVLRISGVQQKSAWEAFWSGISTTIQTSPRLNPVAGDSDSVKAEKAALRTRALNFMNEMLQAASEKRTEMEKESDFSRQAQAFVGNAIRLEDKIRSEETIRVGQTVFGTEVCSPVDIRVSEIHTLKQISSFRADTDAVVKLPRSITQISIDMIFAGASEINHRLRPLLGHLLASPVTSIESPFITQALVNHYSSPEIENEIRFRVSQGSPELSELTAKAQESWENIRDLLKDDDLILEYFRQGAIPDEQKYGPIGDIAAQKNVGNDRLARMGVSIPVALQDIVVSTDPATPNTLHVRLAFIRFNSEAFGQFGLEYRDDDGNRTSDIMKCTVLDRYTQWAYLNKDHPNHYLDEYRAHLKQDADFLCTWKDIQDRELIRSFPNKNGRFVISSVQASLGIRLAVVPLIGSKYPAVQIVGKDNIQAKVTLQTTDPAVVRDFHVMKDHLDAISRNVGGLFRDEQINIQNSVLNLMGGRSFIIAACETSPIERTSDGYEIEMSLVESKYSIRESQSLFLVDRTVPEEAIKAFWNYLWDRYQGFRTKTDKAGPNQVTQTERLAAQILFGKDLDGKGIWNESLINASLLELYGESQIGNQESVSKAYNLIHEQISPFSESQDFGRLILGISSQALMDLPGIDTFLESDARARAGQPAPFIDINDVSPAEVIAKDIVDRFGLNAVDGFRGKYDEKDFEEGVHASRWINLSLLLTQERTRRAMTLKKEIWDAALRVFLRPDRPPQGIRNLPVPTGEKPEYQGRVFSEDQLNKAYLEILWLFHNADVGISRFTDFNWLDYYSDDKGRLVSMSEESDGVRQQLSTNYPDVLLPTYQQMFPDGSKMVTNDRGIQVPAWTRFSPTYSDLGIPPSDPGRDLESMFQTARGYEDIMEPAFWFYHQKLRPGMLQRLKRSMEIAERAPEQPSKRVVKVDLDSEEIVRRSEMTTKRFETLDEVIRKAAQTEENEKVIKEDVKEKGWIADVVTSDGAVIGWLEPYQHEAGNSEYRFIAKKGLPEYVRSQAHPGVAYDRSNKTYARDLMGRVMQHMPDMTFSMARCYPTVRVWFVEWDDNRNREGAARSSAGLRVHMVDDLYSSNCLINVSVTDSKDDASVAVVEILNTLGTFDQDSFFTPNDAKAAGLGGRDDENEDFLKRMRLKTGTGIVIQAGYSSNFADLVTLFTGQIVEVMPGKTMTFIAQGYKTELDQEVGFTVPLGNPRDVIDRLIRVGLAPNDRRNLTPHLGRVFDSRDLNSAEIAALSDSTQGTGFMGLQHTRGSWARWFGSYVTDATRNVWFESALDRTNAVDVFVRNVLWDKVQDQPAGSLPWHFYQTTAWQGLQEMTRHVPGTVTAVRPYETEATLFFGYPDQPYEYRRLTGKEAYDFATRVIPQTQRNALRLEALLIGQFFASDFGTTNDFKHKEHLLNAERYGSNEHTGERFGLSMHLRGSEISAWRDQKQTGTAVLDQISPSYLAFMQWANAQADYSVYALDEENSVISGAIKLSDEYAKIPIFESLSLDFRPDWETINSYNPEFGKFIFAYFFNLQYVKGKPWPGDIESQWRSTVEAGMVPLRGLNGGVTKVWTDWVARFAGLGTFTGGLFDTQYSAVQDSGVLDEETRRDLEQMVQDQDLSIEERIELTNILDGKLQNVRPDLRRPKSTLDANWNSLGWLIFWNFPSFRIFIHYIAQWIRASQNNQDAPSSFRRGEAEVIAESLAMSALPPNYKVFRNYIPIFSSHDIIHNGIVVSEREMHNTVLLRCPKEKFEHGGGNRGVGVTEEGDRVFVSATDWISYPEDEGMPFHEKIGRSRRKMAVCIEPNATMGSRRANTLLGNMAEVMRPMYRGEIKFVGRPVSPWDILIISDDYSSMHGCVEVDRVIHNFDSVTGWTTTVEPHAYCHVNNPWSMAQIANAAAASSTVEKIVDIAFGAWMALAIVTGAGALVAAGTAGARMAMKRKAVDWARKQFGERLEAIGPGLSKMIGVDGMFRKTIQAQAREFLASGAVPGLKKAALASGGRMVGRVLAQNWQGVLSRMASRTALWVGFHELALPVWSAIDDFGMKVQLGKAVLPVDFRPLKYKGMSFTAGLDISDEEIRSFSDQAEGVWTALMASLEDFFSSNLDDSLNAPTATGR